MAHFPFKRSTSVTELAPKLISQESLDNYKIWGIVEFESIEFTLIKPKSYFTWSKKFIVEITQKYFRYTVSGRKQSYYLKKEQIFHSKEEAESFIFLRKLENENF